MTQAALTRVSTLLKGLVKGLANLNKDKMQIRLNSIFANDVLIYNNSNFIRQW
jgi:hypothetical protein